MNGVHVAGPAGRALHVHEGGDPAGRAVLVHHGTPLSGALYAPWIAHAADHGIRLIGYDRPGYGGSDPHPGRTVADAAADVGAIADALGIDRFATWGISGGAPHALACAALLGERVVAAASLAGVAPFDAAGLNYFGGMGSDNLNELGAAMMGREALEPLLAGGSAGMLAASAADLADEMRSLVSEADQAALADGYAEHWSATMPQVFARGIDGWRDDDLAFVAPFGFDVAQINVPVLVWHGRHDLFVPLSHGEWLAREIPGADVRITSDDGHLTLIHQRIPAVHEWLLERF